MANDHRREAGRAPTVSRKGYRKGIDSEHREKAHREHRRVQVEGRRTNARQRVTEGRREGEKLGSHPHDRQVSRQGIKARPVITQSKKIWSITPRALQHIEQNHMEGKKRGKSVFFTTKPCEIWALVYKSMRCPDHVYEDITNHTEVYLKSFATPVGVHGLLKGKCYTVKVVYDQRKHQVITAYPSFS